MINYNQKDINVEWWSPEIGQINSLISLDTETTITPFTSTPEMVIGSAYGGTGVAYLINPSDMESFLSHHSRCSIILHNAPFDVDVIEKTAGSGKFYPFYDSKRIWDTGILYRLYYLATKGYVPRRYNLNLLSEEYFNETLDKGVRMDFAPYLNKTNELTNELKSYAALDAVATYYIYKRLRQLISPLDSSQTTLSHHIQTRGDLALNRLYKRGIGFDLKRRDLWLKAAHKRLNGYAGRLANWGWVRGKKGNNDVFESILRHIGIYDLLPRTETGAVSSKETDLKDYRYIEFIDDFLNYQELEKQITFIADQTEERVHPRYDLLKETGRTSCKSPNFQQLPRKGMIRSMYKAKPGHTFIITDYSSLELATLAQTCLDKFGFSRMAELINQGECLHYNTACSVYQKEKKDITKDERQFAKIPNFALPTNMKEETFATYAAQYGIELDVKRAKKVKQVWASTYPEMKRFWSLPNYEAAPITRTGRVRANTRYTNFLNTFFQGLGADGAKIALYELEKQGMRVVGFVHDEVIIEVNDQDLEKGKEILEKTMIESMRKVVPDVKISVESTFSKRYCK